MAGKGLQPVSPAFEAEALQAIDSLYRTALRLTRDAADAEDLVQDTYLKAFRAAATFRPGTNLRAWLFTILHNTARNRRRDHARQAVEVDSQLVEQAAEFGGSGATSQFDDLPDAFRQAVWLRDVEEFTYAEIAEMLSIPIGTVMSRISRGRRALYQRLMKGESAAVAS